MAFPAAAPASAAGQEGLARRLAPFADSVLSNAIGGLIAAAVLALIAWLCAHYIHHGHPLTHQVKPTVTTSARR